MHPTLDNVAQALLTPDGPSLDTIKRSLDAGVSIIKARMGQYEETEQAVGDFLSSVDKVGLEVLEGTSPQRLEDHLISNKPGTPLAESDLRQAWLKVCEELSRVGGRPSYGGNGWAETWAMTARAQPWPYDEPTEQFDQILNLLGQGQRVVVVRGPGKSSFLAGLRRRLMNASVKLTVPPVVPGALDSPHTVLTDVLTRPEIEQTIRETAAKIELGEDFIGLLGRLGDRQQVVLCVDDAHLQGRSMLLGLPIFVEPAAQRNAILVCSAPDNEDLDGALSDVVADARKREILVDVRLPDISAQTLRNLIGHWGGNAHKDERITTVVDRLINIEHSGLRYAAARAWAQDLARQPGVGFDSLLDAVNVKIPSHRIARTVITAAALEGTAFHPASIAFAVERSAEEVEDIVHDDEFEVDGDMLGGCEAAVPSSMVTWTDCLEGVSPLFNFGDPRVVVALTESMTSTRRETIGGALYRGLLKHYGVEHSWKIADVLFRLAGYCGALGHILGHLVGPMEPGRAEAAFKRLLPVLALDGDYHLGLSRLYGAGMEVGGLFVASAKPGLADQAFQGAAAAAQRLGRGPAAGEALGRLGELRLAMALPEPARVVLELAERLLAGDEYRGSRARITLLIAEVAVLEGRYQDAAGRLSLASNELTLLDDRSHNALANMRWGRLLYELGDTSKAEACLDQAIVHADASQDGRAMGAARLSRAFLYAESGELDSAFALIQKGIEAFQSHKLPIHLFEMLAADLQRRNGQPAAARARLEQVAAAFEKAQAALQWAEAQHGIIRCLAAEDQWAQAKESIKKVKELRVRARDRFGLVRLMVDEGDILMGLGDIPGAYQSYTEALAISNRSGLGLHAAVAQSRLDEHAERFDKAEHLNIDALVSAAHDEVAAMEAKWKAPPQPKSGNQTLH